MKEEQDHDEDGVRVELKFMDRISSRIDFLEMADSNENGSVTLTISESLRILDLEGPEGICVLMDGSILIACTSKDRVCRYRQNGRYIEDVLPGRRFENPSDIFVLSSGKTVIGDARGIQLFDMNCNFIKTLAEDQLDRCHGLCEDSEGNLVTINRNRKRNNMNVKITHCGETDIFFIDVETDKVVKRYQMAELIDDAAQEVHLTSDVSACKYLGYWKSELYVIDHGLDCIFILDKSGTESRIFGKRGVKEGEFRDPTGIIIDDCGTMMILDNRNNRIQLISNELDYAGLVHVSFALFSPF